MSGSTDTAYDDEGDKSMTAVNDFQMSIDQNEAAQQRRARREALLRERGDCERRGLDARVTLVEAELEQLAAEGAKDGEAVGVEAARRRVEAKADHEALVGALIRERAGYLDRGRPDKAALVDAELARDAAEAKPPRKRAETRKTSAARLLGREKT